MLKRMLPAAALCLLAMGCAQENTISTGEKAQAYLDLYLQKYHPGVSANPDGIYILEETPGTGMERDAGKTYIFASTTIRTLGGTISSTTEKELAQQLGSYDIGNYYGPRFSLTGEGASYAGLDALLNGMRVGGTRKAILPAWLLTTSRYDTRQKYIDACSTESNLEYTVTLVGQAEDIDQAERDSLSNYVHRVYGPQVQPTAYSEDAADGSFWFISDSTAFIGTTRFPADTTLQLNYTGRLLNGLVFDTTLEKVAKDAGIYNSSKTYSPASLTVSTNYTEIKLNDSSVITGFEKGIMKMRWLGQKATVLFISSLGYTSSGSGQSIPPYSPLLFELELVKE